MSGRESRRTIAYYQTHYVGGPQGAYVSPLALLEQGTGVTDVIVAAIHVNQEPGDIRLNDDPIDAPLYARMWSELAELQAAGVRVLGMVGGAAQGSWSRLDTEFETYYPHLKRAVMDHRLDGLDLDVEEDMSLDGIVRVVDALRADFGEDFIITLAPVAAALNGGGNLSGFSYHALEKRRGSSIDWYNAQFYCGWGDLSVPDEYRAIVVGQKLLGMPLRPAISPEKVVASALVDPSLCRGYVEPEALASNLRALCQEFENFGGVAGWEYFTAQPGGTERPWEWFGLMSEAMSR